ncbi:MAG: hypothetical protein DRN92_06955 [Thermoproteota archaeon]|nr:MAG: hypothetical protein DRN92_06955 [Candidatus Korarchaeota archaeon]
MLQRYYRGIKEKRQRGEQILPMLGKNSAVESIDQAPNGYFSGLETLLLGKVVCAFVSFSEACCVKADELFLD